MSGYDNRRKHRKQMRPSEIAAVEGVVHDQTKWAVGPHCLARMNAKGVTIEQAYDVLKTGYVIEVNENNDLCVVFRKEFDDFAACVVVSLRTRWVVTVWKNGIKDEHKTLDLSKYKWGVDLGIEMAAFA